MKRKQKNWKGIAVISKTKISELCTIKYGKDHKQLDAGTIPVYGSGGVMRYADKSLHDKASVLIPRKGTLGNLFYVDKPFWTVDTLFWTDIDITKVIPRYLFYALKTKNLASLNVGTAVPSLTTAVLNDVEINLPSLKEQQHVVDILAALDDKIELNRKMNENLEQQAAALFKHWFIDFEFPDAKGKPYRSNGGKMKESPLGPIPDEWEVSKLQDFCSYSHRKAKTGTIQINSYISTDNMLVGQKGMVEATSLPKVNTVTSYKSGDILISNIRPYFQKIWLADRSGGCSNDVLCFTGNRKDTNIFLYYLLKQEEFFAYVVAGSRGTKMPRGDKRQIMNYFFAKPDTKNLENFQFACRLLIQQIQANLKEITLLANARDTLLPQLFKH